MRFFIVYSASLLHQAIDPTLNIPVSEGLLFVCIMIVALIMDIIELVKGGDQSNG